MEKISKSGKERLKKNSIRDIYTIVDGDGFMALLAEKAEKEIEEKRKQEKKED